MPTASGGQVSAPQDPSQGSTSSYPGSGSSQGSPYIGAPTSNSPTTGAPTAGSTSHPTTGATGTSGDGSSYGAPGTYLGPTSGSGSSTSGTTTGAPGGSDGNPTSVNSGSGNNSPTPVSAHPGQTGTSTNAPTQGIPTDGGIPQSGSGVAQSGGGMPQPGSGVASSGGQGQIGVEPPIGSGLPQSGSTTSPSGTTVHQPGTGISQSGGDLPPGQGIPQSGQTTSSSGSTVHGPDTGTTQPSSGATASQPNSGVTVSHGGATGTTTDSNVPPAQTNHPPVTTPTSGVSPIESGASRNNDGISQTADSSIATGTSTVIHGGSTQASDSSSVNHSGIAASAGQATDPGSSTQPTGIISSGHSQNSNTSAAAADFSANSSNTAYTATGQTESGQSHGKHQHTAPHLSSGHHQGADPSVHFNANGTGAHLSGNHGADSNLAHGGKHGIGHGGGWLDMATAHLGGSHAFDVTPPRNEAPKQKVDQNQDQQQIQSQAPDSVQAPSTNQGYDPSSQMAGFDSTPFDSAARNQPVEPEATGGTYTDNSVTASNNAAQMQDDTAQAPGQPSWFDMVSRSFEAANNALSSNDNIVRNIEEDARTLREISENRIRKEETERLDEHKDRETKTRHEHDEKLRLEEKERQEKQEKEQREKRLADEMMTMLALRKESEAITRARIDRTRAEREMMQDIVRKENNQEKYTGSKAEDLGNIARRKFMNPSISQLIYELNPGKVEIKWVNGQPVYVAKPGVTLTLPSQKQVKEWLHTKGNVGKSASQAKPEPHAPGMAGRGQSQTDDRRANIEKILGKIKRRH